MSGVRVAAMAEASVASQALDLTWSAWWRGLSAFHANGIRPRYSIAKARRLLAYVDSTSPLRQLVVLLVYPLPALITSVIPTFVPLHNPSLGALGHSAFFLHGALTTVATFAGGIFQARAVNGISDREVSTREVAIITVGCVVVFWLIMGSLGVLWRFPVPFTMVLGAVPYNAAQIFVSMAVLHRILLRPTASRQRLLLYLPCNTLQIAQILFYPVYSVLFEAANQAEQVVLIAMFPICKFYIKRVVVITSYHLGDFAREVGVAGVEICASIYQATIMQTTPTLLSSVFIVAVDVLQSVLELFHYLSKDLSAVTRLGALLTDPDVAINDAELDKFATRHSRFWISMRRVLFPRFATVKAVISTTKKRQTFIADRDMRSVAKALEILQSIESIVLIEYLEVVAPVVNTVFLLVASRFPSAVYNPRVQPFYQHPTELSGAVTCVVIYSALQVVTLVVLCIVGGKRCRVSVLGLLAFVLETHVWSLQGKMVAWFTFMFAFSVAHYGTSPTSFACRVKEAQRCCVTRRLFLPVPLVKLPFTLDAPQAIALVVITSPDKRKNKSAVFCDNDDYASETRIVVLRLLKCLRNPYCESKTRDCLSTQNNSRPWPSQ